MHLTFHGHACVRLDTDRTRIVIDPGTFADAASALRGASAVLITHEHPDHVDAGAVADAMAAHAELQVWGTPGAVDALVDAGAPSERLHGVEAGEELTLGEAQVRVGGGRHAVIHPRLDQIANRTYTVDLGGAVVHHPGDSFDEPQGAVDVLCLPVSGPWLRIAETIDVTLRTDARWVVPVHDALLSELGHQVTARWLDASRLGGTYTYRRLSLGESLEV